MSIIREERSAIETDDHIPAEWKKHILRFTGWMFTYSTDVDGVTVLGLGIVHPSFDKASLLVVGKENHAKVIMPKAATSDAGAAFGIETLLNEQLKPLQT